MKRSLLFLLTFTIFSVTPNLVVADVSGLVPCKDSTVFKRRLDGSVKKLTTRLEQYGEGTPAYLALETQIEKTQARFNMYGKQGLLCGTDGLPHLIVDGQWNHAGEFMIPGIAFLYITG